MKTRKVFVPKGFIPATYEELAVIAGIPTREARLGVDEMEKAGIVKIIKLGDVLFYKLNL